MNTRFGDVKEPNTNKSIKIKEDDELKNENDVHNENDNMNRFVLTVSQNRPTFNTIEIKFMTRDAVRLIDPEIIPQGKKKTFLPAIRSFDTRINKIINASRQDDPFADQVLLDTERAINHFNETITEQTNGLRSQIKALFELNEAKLKLDNNAHAFTVRAFRILCQLILTKYLRRHPNDLQNESPVETMSYSSSGLALSIS